MMCFVVVFWGHHLVMELIWHIYLFAESVHCLIADKPECNIIVGSDCVYLPYLNTSQISAKSEGMCLKVSLANVCSK